MIATMQKIIQFTYVKPKTIGMKKSYTVAAMKVLMMFSVKEPEKIVSGLSMKNQNT